MARLIAGFLLGVAVTIAVFYLIGDRSMQVQPGPADQPDRANGEVKADRIEKSGKVDAPSDSGDQRRVLPPSQESYADPSTSQAASAPQSGDSTPKLSSAVPKLTANRDYPPEIADMIENRVSKDLQARYEADQRDESWATYMEGQLWAYFSQKPELAQFNFSLIDCRTTICEIHVLGYGPDALTAWNVGTADLVPQPWHDFRSMSMNRHNPEPDILAIVLILTRKVD
jgi:hypothetical protein